MSLPHWGIYEISNEENRNKFNFGEESYLFLLSQSSACSLHIRRLMRLGKLSECGKSRR